MATGDGRIFNCTGASHSATTIASAAYAGYVVNMSELVDSVLPAGAPGAAAHYAGPAEIRVTLFAADPAEINGLIGDAAGNFVINFKKEGGAAGTCTIKSVVWTGLGNVNFPRAQTSGQIPAGLFAVSGVANWDAADTLATMIAFA
ncbi:MAG: hypothetical protein GX591_20525 [Planctomycetes bacterium]|nr:hypothetical protein [Planctomycetota bacterium]